MPRYESRAKRTFASRRDVVWAIVADTNRMNRALGNVAAKYGWREVDGKREYVASAKDLGQTIEWIEPPYQWIEGELIETERKFVSGPVDRGSFGVRLNDSPDGGTDCEMSIAFEGKSPILAAIGWIVGIRQRSALGRALDAVGIALVAGSAFAGEKDEPAVVRAQRMLTAGYDETTSGPRSPVDEAALSLRLEKLLRQSVDPKLAKRLGEWLSTRPDEEVAQIRPFEVARVWGASRRDVLGLFLHATRVGLVDLRWQINCPVCRVSAQVTESLKDVGSDVHCAACNVSYGVDFGRYVEAVFQSNPQVRRVSTAVFCAASPVWRPHVFAQATLAPGAERIEHATLPLGDLHSRSLGMASASKSSNTGDTNLEKAPRTLTLSVSDDAVHLDAEGQSPDGRTELRLHSTASTPKTILLERSGWNADQVTGSVVSSFPEFLDLFATEAPATGAELTIGQLTVLFSDLTGSTALYERVGDAKAFAIVEHHFSLMERVIHAHEGAVVKTMGDAVMATFPSAALGVSAAIEMVRVHDREQGPLGLGVKLGVHTGACLAVRANDRLDFFGTTVNVSARLQAQAHPSELVLGAEVARDPQVRPLLEGLPQRTFEAHLKGITDVQSLIGVDCAEAPRAANA